MKAHKKFMKFCFALIFLLPGISCLKETDKAAKCKLIRIKYERPQGAYIDITYNNDGRISTMKTFGLGYPDRAYNYFGNTIVVTHGGPGNYVRDTIFVDDNGRPVNIRKYFPTEIDYQFGYNGNDLSTIIVTRAISGIPYTATTNYLNGNMIGYTYGSYTVNYEYYTDRNVQAGDYLEVLSLLDYGISIYPHKNLIKGIEEPAGGITNYAYEFNDDGLITKVTSTNGTSSGFVTYQYQCE
jgi:hypothetical protein